MSEALNVKPNARNNILSQNSEFLQEFLCTDPSPSVDSQLHFADLLVYFLHELDNEINQLVLVHLLGMEVGDQEADVVAFDRFTPQHDEVLCSHHHEAHKLVTQDFLDFIGLLDADANT